MARSGHPVRSDHLAPAARVGAGSVPEERALAARVGSAREARWILEHVHGDLARAHALAARRAAGEPLQYVLGTWPFRRLDLRVDRRVLIPRPETEQLVEVALAELAELAEPVSGRGTVAVDLGTGSGAIALSLAHEASVRGLAVWATDVSPDALAVAARNLAGLERRDRRAAARVRLAEGDWFAALPGMLRGSVDLVVANPPYISEADFVRIDPVVRGWEPRRALVAPDAMGVGGMGCIEHILTAGADWLAPGGALVLEMDPRQGPGALDVARRAGFLRSRTGVDLTGRTRMLVARR